MLRCWTWWRVRRHVLNTAGVEVVEKEGRNIRGSNMIARDTELLGWKVGAIFRAKNLTEWPMNCICERTRRGYATRYSGQRFMKVPVIIYVENRRTVLCIYITLTPVMGCTISDAELDGQLVAFSRHWSLGYTQGIILLTTTVFWWNWMWTSILRVWDSRGYKSSNLFQKRVKTDGVYLLFCCCIFRRWPYGTKLIKYFPRRRAILANNNTGIDEF